MAKKSYNKNAREKALLEEAYGRVYTEEKIGIKSHGYDAYIRAPREDRISPLDEDLPDIPTVGETVRNAVIDAAAAFLGIKIPQGYSGGGAFARRKKIIQRHKERESGSEEAAEDGDMNAALLNYLNQNASSIKHYKKFAKVKAIQSKGGEEIQTKIDGTDETGVRTTNPGDWVVSNIESQGEQQIVDDKTFQKRYDVANSEGDIYSPSGANYFGVVYDGSLGDNITFNPPNWGGANMNITKGYMIGGPDPKNFGADFYGIEPVAFKKTYKPAELVQ